MISTSSIAALDGAKVIDRNGDKIGTVGQVYVDPTSGRPNWVAVRTGLFGTSESFVPLDQATEVDGDIQVPYEKAFVKDAPRIDDDAELSQQEEDELYAYYSGPGLGTRNTSGPTADDAMTRSEERLTVGTEQVETGRARLRKYIVTENQKVDVPVSREEVRIEREPITDANVGDAMSGPELSEEEHEVILHEERPVVEKETVPVERVRLDADTVTDTETVDEDVRKERIDVEGDGRGSRV